MNNLQKLLFGGVRQLTMRPMYSYYFPHSESETHHKVHMVVLYSQDSQQRGL